MMDEQRNSEAWAQRLAAQLPPFTPAEAAEVGRLAASIDARRAHGASSSSPADRETRPSLSGAARFAQLGSIAAGYRDVVITIDLANATEAARMLRAALEALPPRTPADRATARRIQGAVLALGAIAHRPTNERL